MAQIDRSKLHHCLESELKLYKDRHPKSYLMYERVQEFEQIYKQVNNLSFTDPNARLLKRLIFANTTRVDIDKIGRILIPSFLREVANLSSSTAVFIGAGNNFEIWAPDEWEKQNELLLDNETNAQRFSALNLRVD